MAAHLFEVVGDVTEALTNEVGPHGNAIRVMKLMEECGEACEAYIGMTGSNPRKGFTHTLDDLLNELADVAITALCAMHHYTADAEDSQTIVMAKIEKVASRLGVNVRGDES